MMNAVKDFFGNSKLNNYLFKVTDLLKLEGGKTTPLLASKRQALISWQ